MINFIKKCFLKENLFYTIIFLVSLTVIIINRTLTGFGSILWLADIGSICGILYTINMAKHNVFGFIFNIISTIAILKALGLWNEYWMTYLFYGAHPTLAVGLNSMKIKAEARPLSMTGPMFAMMMVSVIPVVIFYICCQKRLMTVTIGGGIKG